jgi:hypothetical protein
MHYYEEKNFAGAWAAKSSDEYPIQHKDSQYRFITKVKDEHVGLPLYQLRLIYGMTPEMQEWLDAVNDTGRIGIPGHAKALVDRLAERKLIHLDKTGSIWIALSLGEAASSGKAAGSTEAGNSDAGSGGSPLEAK